MKIVEITKNKESFIDILLIGDEEISMINKYLIDGMVYALYDKNMLASICVVLKINSNTLELKNLATYPNFQNRGYGSALIEHICKEYRDKFEYLILGTGENEMTLNFYKNRGFKETHRINNFFTHNYKHKIFENGKQLIDMIYLKRKL